VQKHTARSCKVNAQADAFASRTCFQGRALPAGTLVRKSYHMRCGAGGLNAAAATQPRLHVCQLQVYFEHLRDAVPCEQGTFSRVSHSVNSKEMLYCKALHYFMAQPLPASCLASGANSRSLAPTSSTRRMLAYAAPTPTSTYKQHKAGACMSSMHTHSPLLAAQGAMWHSVACLWCQVWEGCVFG